MGHHKQLTIELQEGGYSAEVGDEGESYFFKEFPNGRVYVEQDGEIWTFCNSDPFGHTKTHATLDEAEAVVA